MAEPQDPIGTGTNGDPGTSGAPAGNPTDQQPSGGNPTPSGEGTQQPNDDVITLKKDDYNNLISQRDKNHQQGNDQVSELTETVGGLMRDKAIETAQKDYPDVPREILETAGDPEQLETIAKAYQKHADELKNKTFQDLHNVNGLPTSREELLAELKKLEGTGNLERALEIKSILTRK